MVPNQQAAFDSPVVSYSNELGKTVVYQGNEAGYFSAFDAASGEILWSDNLGSNIRDTALVDGNSVWVSPTYAPHMNKIDGSTGAILCSSPLLASINYSTPTIGKGPGGATEIFVGANGISATVSGPVYAINANTCAIDWKFTNYDSPAGQWAPISYATDANGRGLVLFGTDNPDSSVYAVDAVTGTKVWSFKPQPAKVGGTEDDVGVAPSVSAPGVNGFSGGVAYVPSQGGHIDALNLTTGQQIWDFDFGTAYHMNVPYSRATASVLGNKVFFGNTDGVLCLNATTGAVVWHWEDAPTPQLATEVIGNSTVVGPPGKEVVAVTDLSGNFEVLSAATGALLYQHQTGGYSLTSVAESEGNFYVTSSGGFLYDFAVGGSNAGTPTTTVTAPADGTMVPNPGGHLAITGTAAGGPIASVDVAIQSEGPTGPWWNAAKRAWESGFADNTATLVSPGAASTKWSLNLPVPVAGGSYSVKAVAQGTNGLADLSAYSSEPSPGRSSFSVSHLQSAPHLATDQGIYVAPSNSITVVGSGFAPGEDVAISLVGTTLLVVHADSTGSFPSTPVTVPSNAAFGQTSLLATGATSGLTSATEIYVSNQWSSFGNGSLHQEYEPFDQAFVNHVAGSNQSFLTPAWTYPSGSGSPSGNPSGDGAAIRTSPAILKGVAYFGDDAGLVSAIDIHTSKPIWMYSAGSAVDSSPAAGFGIVTFGTTSGSVVALSQITGTVLWSTPTSSPVESPPSLVGGLVYVGSNDGTLYALRQATGRVVWKVTLGGAIKGSPTVDPATHEVVVGDASGAIRALNSATGAQLWSVNSGGPVTATAMIYNGQVFVGSGSGNVYALNETTGATVWSFVAGSAVTANGSFWNQGDYVIGTAHGDIFYLRITNGTVDRQFHLVSPIIGVSASVGWVVLTLADGQVVAYKFPNQTSWRYTSPMPLASSVAIVNGVVYVTSEDSTITAFIVPGKQIP